MITETSNLSVEDISELSEWAFFKGLTEIANGCIEYLATKHVVINPKSQLGKRKILRDFYDKLNFPWSYDIVRAFDSVRQDALEEFASKPEWEVFRKRIVKTIGLHAFAKLLSLDLNSPKITPNDIKTVPPYDGYELEVTTLYRNTCGGTDEVDLTDLLGPFNKGKNKASKTKLYALVEEFYETIGLPHELYGFVRNLELAVFPTPRDNPIFFDAGDFDEAHMNEETYSSHKDAHSVHKSVSSPPISKPATEPPSLLYRPPGQHKSLLSTLSSISPVIRNLATSASVMGQHNHGRDPLPLALESSSAAPLSKTLGLTPESLAAIRSNKRKTYERGKARRPKRAGSKKPFDTLVDYDTRAADEQEGGISVGLHPDLATGGNLLDIAKSSSTAVAASTGEQMTFTDTEDSQHVEGKRIPALKRQSKGRRSLPVLPGRENGQRLRWTEAEDQALLAGVQKYGKGQWRIILDDPELGPLLNLRSNINLKDRVRNLELMLQRSERAAALQSASGEEGLDPHGKEANAANEEEILYPNI